MTTRPMLSVIKPPVSRMVIVVLTAFGNAIFLSGIGDLADA